MSLDAEDEDFYYFFSDEEMLSFIDKVDYAYASGIVASVCAMISILTFLILLSSSYFRLYNKILITLALANIIALTSIAYQNFHQFYQYCMIVALGKLPQKTSWDCAVLPWVFLKLIGDLWPPAIQAMMGVERAIAVFRPIYYRNIFSQRTLLQLTITVFFVLGSIAMAYILAAINVIPGFGTCGRKNAFSREYGVYLYLVNIFGYLISFILSLIAFIKAQGTSLPSNTRQRQIRKAQYYLLISLISVICISAPNISSIINAFFPKLPNFISKPASWMACANFASSFFVYFFLIPEFRNRSFSLVQFKKNSITVIKSSDMAIKKSTTHYY